MNEWIKTTDRLPEFSGVYFTAKKSCLTRRNGDIFHYWSKKIKVFNSDTNLFSDFVFSDPDKDLPDYWMPLPEDPEECL